MRLLPRSALNWTLDIVAGMLDVVGSIVIIKFVISDSNTFEANMPSCLYSITWYYSENVTEEVGPLSWLTHAGSSTQVFIGHSLSTCMCCMHCGNARSFTYLFYNVPVLFCKRNCICNALFDFLYKFHSSHALLFLSFTYKYIHLNGLSDN